MVTKQERLELLEREIERLRHRIDNLERRSSRYSWTRVGIFFGGLAIGLLVAITTQWWIGLLVAVLTLLVFLSVAYFHNQIEQSLARHSTMMAIKEAQVARIQLDWLHIPAAPGKEAQPHHPFEIDLDISGEHSLHTLLNTAVSREGSLRLLDWLMTTRSELATSQARQALVRELTPLTRFRDRLNMMGLLAARRHGTEIEGKRLLNWLARQQKPASALLPWLWLAIGLNALTIVLFVLGILGYLPQVWTLSMLLTLILLFGTNHLRGEMFEEAGYLSSGFSTLSRIFAYLQNYPYPSGSRLSKLCEPFYADREQTPLALLRRIANVASAATLKRNGLLWLMVNAVLPWDMYCAYRLARNKEQVTTRLPVWLNVWFEVEALCSLATFAYLNPEYVFPEIADQSDFTARELGHPLIPATRKVANDFALSGPGQIDIVTGSNMSGKSTFLRTLGVNLVLTYAGGPVSASSLRTGSFRLFSCIRVSDSVTDGYSYFYAEVRRLRALLVELEQPDSRPLFFLIDEIFKGTNNRERLIGSRSFVRALAGQNCLGALSTHDLELVRLADELPMVHNYHFREEVVNGEMIFDYKLRTGPSPTTNALKIMRLEGLPVEEEEVS
jgi:ABC-type multidrug transport system fused ATPase/permease subunit